MVDRPRDPHAWFHSRLDAFFLDLLEESEQRRFEEHAESCPTCVAAMKTFGDNLPTARSEHIPARMLARWDRSKHRLRGLARRMVREHLASCSACRQDLEALGFKPVLELDAALEEDLPLEERPISRATETDGGTMLQPLAPPPQPIVIVQGRPTSRHRAWLFGGAGGAALAAAVLLVVVPFVTRTSAPPLTPPTTSPVPPPPVTPSPPTDASPPAGSSQPGLTLGVLGGPSQLLSPTRGPEDRAVPEILIGDDTPFVHVTVPDLYLPDTTRLAIEVVGPSGKRALAEIAHGELARGRTLLIGDPSKRLEPGLYRLAIRSKSDPPGTPRTEWRVRLISR